MTVQDKAITQEICEVCLKHFWLKKRKRLTSETQKWKEKGKKKRRREERVYRDFRYFSSVNQTCFLSTSQHSLNLISKNIFLFLKKKTAVLSLAKKTSRLITFGKACKVFKVWRSSWHLVASRKLFILHHARSCLREVKRDPVTFTTRKKMSFPWRRFS